MESEYKGLASIDLISDSLPLQHSWGHEMTNIPNRLNLLTLLALQLGLSNTASCDCPQYSVRWTSLILMRCSSLTSFDVYLQPFFSYANE